jgi:hypothetical protein
MTANGLPLWDIIATSRTGYAFGVSFGNEPDATAYAARLTSFGYTVDVIDHGTETDLESAFRRAAEAFADPRLLTPGPRP